MSCCTVSPTDVLFNDVPVIVDGDSCRLEKPVPAVTVTLRNKTPFRQVLTIAAHDPWLSGRFEGINTVTELSPRSNIELEISLVGAHFGTFTSDPISGSLLVSTEHGDEAAVVPVEMRLRDVSLYNGAAGNSSSSLAENNTPLVVALAPTPGKAAPRIGRRPKPTAVVPKIVPEQITQPPVYVASPAPVRETPPDLYISPPEPVQIAPPPVEETPPVQETPAALYVAPPPAVQIPPPAPYVAPPPVEETPPAQETPAAYVAPPPVEETPPARETPAAYVAPQQPVQTTPPPVYVAPPAPEQVVPPPVYTDPPAPVQIAPPPVYGAPPTPVNLTLPPDYGTLTVPVQLTVPPDYGTLTVPVQLTVPPDYGTPTVQVQKSSVPMITVPSLSRIDPPKARKLVPAAPTLYFPSPRTVARRLFDIVFTLIGIVLFPFYTLPHTAIAQGIGDAAHDRYTDWRDKLSEKNRTTFKRATVSLNVAYLLVFGGFGFHWLDHRLHPINLMNVSATLRPSMILDCNTESIPASLPLSLEVSEDSGKPAQQYPLIVDSTHLPAISGPGPLHLAVENTFGWDRTYSVRVVAKDIKSNRETFFESKSVKVAVPLPEPAGLTVTPDIENGKANAGKRCQIVKFHLDWQKPPGESVSRVVVWRTAKGYDATDKPQIADVFTDPRVHSWTSVEEIVPDDGTHTYQQFQIAFEDKDHNSRAGKLSKWQRIMFKGVQEVADPVNDERKLNLLGGTKAPIRSRAPERRTQQKQKPVLSRHHVTSPQHKRQSGKKTVGSAKKKEHKAQSPAPDNADLGASRKDQ